jgi:hypothetical protein
MAMKQYSLLDYNISITAKTTGITYSIPVGGIGSYLGSITVAKSTDQISKTVDATGSGVFSYSHDHSGTIDIEISQVSEKVGDIINKIMDYYHSETIGDWKKGLVDIEITKIGQSKPVIDASDCMLVKMPDLAIGAEVAMRTFSFVAIEIREHYSGE